MPAKMVAGALPSVEEVLTFIFSCFAEAWVLQPRGDEAVRCRWAQHPRAPGERGRGASPISPGPCVPLTRMWLFVPGKAEPTVTEVKNLFWTERVYRAELKVNCLFAV